MEEARNRTRRNWGESLAAASQDGGPTGAAWLFFEQREDLRIEAGSKSGLSTVRTRGCGLAVDPSDLSGRSIYLADPDLGQLGAAIRSLQDEASFDAINPPKRVEGPEDDAWSPDLGLESARERTNHALQRAARQHPGAAIHVRSVAFDQHVWICGPDGRTIQDRRRGSRIRIEIRLSTGSRSGVAVGERAFAPDRGLQLASIGRLVDQTAARARARTESTVVSSGESPVVFAPGLGGILIHEIVGHALEADRWVSGESWLAQFKERPVAPEELTVVDDPRRGRAPWTQDDEGESARANALVRHGHVVGALYDRTTAARAGCQSNGHGRRSSYREPIRPRMGCTFVAPGRREPGELMSSIRQGVYIRRMEAAHTDPATGVATFQVSDADELTDGKLGRPLAPFILVVQGDQALPRLSVASDLIFDPCIGSCHRDGQPLAISVGAPTMLIRVARISS